MKLLIIILLLFTLSIVKGESGYNFLKMEHTPLSISTAGTSYLFSPRGESINFNPAFLSRLKGTSTAVSYATSIEDSYFTTAELNHDPGVGNISVIFNSYGIEDLEGRVKPSEDPQYSFDAKTTVSGIGYSYEFNKNLAIGGSYRLVFEKIEFDESWAHTFNTGVYYSGLLDGLTLSTHISDLGITTKMENRKEDLPFSINGGASYNYTHEDYSAIIAISDKYDINDEKNFLKIGSELSWKNTIFLRGGYRFENDDQDISFGAGFKVYGIGFDYSFTPSENFDDTQAISLYYSFI